MKFKSYNCEDCCYFVPHNSADVSSGTCQKDPPQAVRHNKQIISVWPVVMFLDGCGQWSEGMKLMKKLPSQKG